MLTALLLAASVHAAAPPDGAALRERTRELLKALIRIDTSNPPGNELPAAEYLKRELGKDGVASRVRVSEGRRASLIARLSGSGALRPLVLMCHTDVVPAQRSGWKTDPFEPVERGGYLYGRGAADIKSMCAAEAAVLGMLKTSGVALQRDVVFFAEADEEVGGRGRHIEWLLAHHGAELDAEYAINEGGQTVWRDGAVAEIRVQAAEKEFVDVHLKASGTPGHASVPPLDNPVAAVARAVVRLSEHRWPARIEPVARGFLEHQRDAAEAPARAALEAVLRAEAGEPLDRAVDKLAAIRPDFAAMMRDTVTPTILAAGYKSNVVPGEAKATLNARLLPGRDVEAFRRELTRIVADPAVHVELESQNRPATAAMPADGPMMEAVEAAAASRSPGARVMPFLSAWTTDGQDLRARGVKVYGVDPPLSTEDEERVHGDDERISLAALDWYVEFLWDVVVRLAAPGPSPKPAGLAR